MSVSSLSLSIQLTFFTTLAFDVRPAIINRTPFSLILISRRSRYRAGTRYFTRGIDSAGHVANFNETEQIILLDDPNNEKSGLGEPDSSVRLSFVQTRGSIPVYWAEINNLRYTPDIQIMELDDTVRLPIVPPVFQH